MHVTSRGRNRKRIIVGMASAVHYVHSDKRPQLWINEVGVATAYRARGLGKALLSKLLDTGRVLTDRPNIAAMRLYSSLGGVESRNDQVMFTFRFETR